MKHLRDSWDSIWHPDENKALFLGFDYDGTLTPIVGHPDQAELDQEVKWLLDRLVRNPRSQVAVISGRSLPDIIRKVGLKNITYAGNHGLEMRGPGNHLQHFLSLNTREHFKRLAGELTELLADVPGAWLEDKAVTMSLHYRQAVGSDIVKLKRSFREICRPYIANNAIVVSQGKKVLEICPAIVWNKGHAVLWLLTKMETVYGINGVVAVYFGDDRTDDDVFKILNGTGITVSVGERPSSHAKYYLKSPLEVKEFLLGLASSMSEAGKR